MQISLFIESEQEAFDALAMQLGGKKQLACRLRRDLEDDPEAAHRWYLDCTNPERRSTFHGKHYILAARIAREAGFQDFIDWFGRETGYECKPAVRPSQAMQALERSRRYMELASQAQEDYERAMQKEALQAGLRSVG